MSPEFTKHIAFSSRNLKALISRIAFNTVLRPWNPNLVIPHMQEDETQLYNNVVFNGITMQRSISEMNALASQQSDAVAADTKVADNLHTTTD